MLKSLVLYSLTILFNIITATPHHELNSQPQLCFSTLATINIDSSSISSNMSDTTAANQAYFKYTSPLCVSLQLAPKCYPTQTNSPQPNRR